MTLKNKIITNILAIIVLDVTLLATAIVVYLESGLGLAHLTVLFAYVMGYQLVKSTRALIVEYRTPAVEYYDEFDEYEEEERLKPAMREAMDKVFELRGRS